MGYTNLFHVFILSESTQLILNLIHVSREEMTQIVIAQHNHID